jgi:ribosomal protein L11 methyltransferase
MDLLVRLVVPASQVDVAVDRLWTSGATAVEERASDVPAGAVTLLAGFPTPEAARAVAGALIPWRAEVEEVDDGWRDVWKRFAQPIEVETLVVAPAWRPVDAGDGRLVLSIDPGGCFGSGTHPTTRLLLAQLVRRIAPGSSVFDVGTGSGILAVAAASLGAGRVVAVDIDPDAARVAAVNAAANHVASRVEVSTSPAASVTGRFDLVLANLTAATLASLAGVLVGAVGSGGLLLVSGMLPGQWDHISDRFAPLEVEQMLELEGWVGVVLRSGSLPSGPA